MQRSFKVAGAGIVNNFSENVKYFLDFMIIIY